MAKKRKSRDYLNGNISFEDLAEPKTNLEKKLYIKRFEDIYGKGFKLGSAVDPAFDEENIGKSEEEIMLERIKDKLFINKYYDSNSRACLEEFETNNENRTHKEKTQKQFDTIRFYENMFVHDPEPED